MSNGLPTMTFRAVVRQSFCQAFFFLTETLSHLDSYS